MLWVVVILCFTGTSGSMVSCSRDRLMVDDSDDMSRVLDDHHIRMGVILPGQPVSLSQDPCPSSLYVMHAIDIALTSVHQRKLRVRRNGSPIYPTRSWTGHIGQLVQLTGHLRDSRCSDTHGPLAAMSLYFCDSVQAFLGPCCKYALSPVARYNSQWGLPIITTGGLNQAFSNKTEFPLLTRVVAPYHKFTMFMLAVLREFRYRHVSLLWHNNYLHRSLGVSECHHVMEPLILKLREVNHIDPYKEIFDEIDMEDFEWAEIFQAISNHSRGKQPSKHKTFV